MEFLLLLIVFFSQIVVYIVHAFLKKTVNRWLSLMYSVLNVVLALPIGFIVLFLAVMGTDSGTDEANRASMIFLLVSAAVYLLIFVVSLWNTIKSFREHEKQTKTEEGSE